MKAEISKLIYNELNYVYCGNCRFNKEIDEDDDCNGCKDCHPKTMEWEISKNHSDSIAEKIINLTQQQGDK